MGSFPSGSFPFTGDPKHVTLHTECKIRCENNILQGILVCQTIPRRHWVLFKQRKRLYCPISFPIQRLMYKLLYVKNRFRMMTVCPYFLVIIGKSDKDLLFLSMYVCKKLLGCFERVWLLVVYKLNCMRALFTHNICIFFSSITFHLISLLLMPTSILSIIHLFK